MIDLTQFGVIPRMPPQGGFPAVPLAPAVAQQLGANLHPVGPSDPGYKSRMPPPAPDPIGTPAPEAPSAMTTQQIVEVTASLEPSPARQRVFISFGPEAGKVVLGVEEAPDWESDFSTVVSAAALREMLPLLRKITKIKDLTGGMAYQEVSNGVESGH